MDRRESRNGQLGQSRGENEDDSRKGPATGGRCFFIACNWLQSAAIVGQAHAEHPCRRYVSFFLFEKEGAAGQAGAGGQRQAGRQAGKGRGRGGVTCLPGAARRMKQSIFFTCYTWVPLVLCGIVLCSDAPSAHTTTVCMDYICTRAWSPVSFPPHQNGLVQPDAQSSFYTQRYGKCAKVAGAGTAGG